MVDVLAFGEPLLEFNSLTEGGLGAGSEFAVGYGGDSSNFAVAARRAGAGVGYVTRIGDDGFGAALRSMWQREDVRCEHVVREPGGRTGIYFIDNGPSGRRFTYYRVDSPASRLSERDIPVDAVAAARLVHLTGITQAISSSACDMSFAVAELARRSGTLVSYDPNYRPALWPVQRARAVVSRSVELCDVALPNIEEGRLLTGREQPEDVIAEFVRLGPSIVVLKLGADGALLATGGEVTAIAPYPVRALDPSGAGDTFDGAFVARLLDGATAADAARYAAVAAALTTTGLGAVLPIPHRDTVDALLAEHGATAEDVHAHR